MRREVAKKTLYYTYDEVMVECLEMITCTFPVFTSWWHNHQGKYMGINYIMRFVETERGWIKDKYHATEKSVYDLIGLYGTESDRAKVNSNILEFNAKRTKEARDEGYTGPDLVVCEHLWSTHKEMAKFLRNYRQRYDNMYRWTTAVSDWNERTFRLYFARKKKTGSRWKRRV